MKKSKKIICGIAGTCIILGAVLIGAGFAMGGTLFNSFSLRGDIFHLSSWRVGNEGESTKETQTIQIEDFQSIDLDIGYGDIEIIKGNAYSLRIENVPEDQYTIKQENGVLSIHQKDTTLFNFSMDFRNPDYKYTITVPSNVEEISVNSAMGDVKIERIEADNLYIDQSMGEVDVEDVRINKTLRIEQRMGNIDFSGISEGIAEFTNSMGDSDIEIRGNEADYQYELSTSMGTLEVNDRKRGDGMNASFENGNGMHRISVKNSMGDISLEFR